MARTSTRPQMLRRGRRWRSAAAKIEDSPAARRDRAVPATASGKSRRRRPRTTEVPAARRARLRGRWPKRRATQTTEPQSPEPPPETRDEAGLDARNRRTSSARSSAVVYRSPAGLASAFRQVRFSSFGNRVQYLPRRTRVGVDDPVEHFEHRLADEWSPSGQEFVEHDAQTEYV